MPDLSQLSDEELAQIAGVKLEPKASGPDLSSLSNEELAQAAGIQLKPTTTASRIGAATVDNLPALGGMIGGGLGALGGPPGMMIGAGLGAAAGSSLKGMINAPDATGSIRAPTLTGTAQATVNAATEAAKAMALSALGMAGQSGKNSMAAVQRRMDGLVGEAKEAVKTQFGLDEAQFQVAKKVAKAALAVKTGGGSLVAPRAATVLGKIAAGAAKAAPQGSGLAVKGFAHGLIKGK